ncbi:hypothetical protein DI09_23p60 [Mitosporidium daphniae]|uniref:Uncharacterized protein n=1 Tax=Mitosporidium daphniae TaxID=1485682 RepID=A0A098VW37_9MICR|nr:uncharacterized protein DI09_23p60 [Mitosporidium daphniae]KGG51931.1 hypothetical protein DI09_23p60 [Mitosporidium daphniae]|eukprot:XP_013238385.1 uncharacterized protein DI09_23p60 [Mitosporidium daphniae]
MTYNAPTTIYYKSAQRLLNIGRKIIKREALRLNDRLLKLACKKRANIDSMSTHFSSQGKRRRQCEKGLLSLYDQVQQELSFRANALPVSTRKVLEAKVALFKKFSDGSWLFSSRNRTQIPSVCYNSDGSLNCGMSCSLTFIGQEKDVREMLIGPFHDKMGSTESTLLLGPSSQILASVLSKNLNSSQMVGKPTSSFWLSSPSNCGSRFYDSLGYPIEDFISPSLCLAYGDPKGKEFISKLLRMDQSTCDASSSSPSRISRVLSKLADDMTLGGHSFMESIAAFKNSVGKSSPKHEDHEKTSNTNICNAITNKEAEDPGHAPQSSGGGDLAAPQSSGGGDLSAPQNPGNYTACNDQLLFEISSLLIKMNSIKSQLLSSRSVDPSLKVELGSVSSELKEKLSKIARQCSPADLLGPRTKKVRIPAFISSFVVRAILQREENSRKYAAKNKRKNKAESESEASSASMSDTDISLSEDSSFSEAESLEAGSFSSEDGQTDDFELNEEEGEEEEEEEGEEGEEGEEEGEQSNQDDDELGGIAYPSSSEDEEEAFIEKIIYDSEIKAWKESVHKLSNASSVDHAPSMDFIRLVKKIISAWNRMVSSQYPSCSHPNKKNKRASSLVAKTQQKIRAETEDVEVAFFSLVFENIFRDFLWIKFSNSGSARPQHMYPEEVKRLRNPIKGVIEALTSIFDHAPSGSWMHTIILGEPLERMLPFFAIFPVAFSRLLKILITKVWISLPGENDEMMLSFKRLQSFLLTTCFKYPSFASKIVVKTAYASWIKSLVNMSVHKHENAGFLLESLCELFFAIQDAQKQYDFAFLSLRALALSARSQLVTCATSSEKKKGQLVAQGGQLKVVPKSWTFIYAIRFWSRVIGTTTSSVAKENSPLMLLKYPLLQIISAGVAASGKCPREIPYQLHLVDCAVSFLQVSIGLPIETLLRIIKEVIESIRKPGKMDKKPADPVSLDWKSLLKGPADASAAPWYWDLVGRRASYLFAKCALLHSSSADFPEVVGLPLRWVSILLNYL